MEKTPKVRQRRDRLRHYLGLVLLLTLGTAGGFVALNCAPVEATPEGRVLEDPSQVKFNAGGRLAFDPSSPPTARVQLPATLKVTGREGGEVGVNWEVAFSDRPKGATMESSNVAVIPAPAGAGQTHCFIGSYTFDGEVRRTRYCVTTVNQLL